MIKRVAAVVAATVLTVLMGAAPALAIGALGDGRVYHHNGR